MNILIDSHILVWVLEDPDRLGPKARALLVSSDTMVCISVVSFWELHLKYLKGKFGYPFKTMKAAADEIGASSLELSCEHLLSYGPLKGHSDPFDLLLCAQAEAEGLGLLTADKVLFGLFGKAINARM